MADTPKVDVTDSVETLEALQDADNDALTRALKKRLDEIARTQTGDPSMTLKTQLQMVGVLSSILTVADVLGRAELLAEVDELARRAGIVPIGDALPPDGPPAPPRLPPSGAPGGPARPRFVFREAVRAIEQKEPRLARSAQEIFEIYARGDGFAAMQSADVQLTRRVQRAIVKLEREQGAGAATAARVISEATGWTEGYSETVWRTNMGTGYSQGRVAQARRPEVKAIAPAFELLGPGFSDPGTRDNHAAAVGLVASTDDPIWFEFMPPLGFNCRHSVSLVPRTRFARMRGSMQNVGGFLRKVPSRFREAHRDPGFAQGAFRR